MPDDLINRRTDDVSVAVPTSMTMTERLLLANQERILAALVSDDADYYTRRSEILEEGYTAEYGDVFAAVEPELTRTECGLVWDLLDMFRILSTSIEELSPADRATLGEQRINRLRFRGFDLADELEGRLLSYVRYLVRGERWAEIGPRLEEIGDNGNSHHRCLPFYRLLLATYRPIIDARTAERGHSLDAYRLDLEQLTELAEVSFR
ncbi:YfbU family protein [Nocardia vermiculata]|uniref:YfbU family protein n=1 Tax=Nocardia vermiculata TaxID=257274 RepID=A0A846Y9P6_9NOCA|nr:YfbU family protein [Nocardia vermiculata]NKY54552.1 YfbU family protein [Nocardia vermiculata]